MEKDEIALKLTLSVIERIKHTDNTSYETMNATLASEVAKAYNVILESIKEPDETDGAEITVGLKPND